jgi:hypothetical protein
MGSNHLSGVMPAQDTPPRDAAGTPSSRASTSFCGKQDVDGRDKPGHDSGEVVR